MDIDCIWVLIFILYVNSNKTRKIRLVWVWIQIWVQFSKMNIGEDMTQPALLPSLFEFQLDYEPYWIFPKYEHKKNNLFLPIFFQEKKQKARFKMSFALVLGPFWVVK